MPNHKYQIARKEAIKILQEKYPKIIDFPSTLLIEELEELTCEIYAQMFAEFLQPLEYETIYYQTRFGSWEKVGGSDCWQGSTFEVHELFKQDKA